MTAPVRALRSDPLSQRLLVIIELQAFIELGPLSLVHIVGVLVRTHLLNVFSFMAECFSLPFKISHSLLVAISSTK